MVPGTAVALCLHAALAAGPDARQLIPPEEFGRIIHETLLESTRTCLESTRQARRQLERRTDGDFREVIRTMKEMEARWERELTKLERRTDPAP